MEIRLITVKEDFEKAFELIKKKHFETNFYEFVLRFDHPLNSDQLKLIGFFEHEECIGILSYQIVHCDVLKRILKIRELYYTNIKAYRNLMDFIDVIAKEENCKTIKICKNKPERLNINLFDRVENFLTNLI